MSLIGYEKTGSGEEVLLKVENVCKSFGKNKVLKGVSFSAKRGEVVSIIGSSGGGKTTLLRCLTLLEKPDSGVITVGSSVIFDPGTGEKVSERELRKRRLHFGLVFQQFNLFPQYSVFDNICLAPKMQLRDENEKIDAGEKKKRIAEIEEKALSLLASVGLTEKKDSYPCMLSGGQQQRVAIARALALSPDILCFDEPTSALDPELTAEVLKVIKELKNTDMTMIIVTHEMEFARAVSDTVIYMADGNIEEMGTPEQVFGSPKSEKTKAFLRHAESKF